MHGIVDVETGPWIVDLFVAKPLPEPIWFIDNWGPRVQYSVKFQSKYT